MQLSISEESYNNLKATFYKITAENKDKCVKDIVGEPNVKNYYVDIEFMQGQELKLKI